MLKWVWILSICLVGCTRNPVTGKTEWQLVSESQEISLGEENYHFMQQAQGGDYVTDPTLQRYIANVGSKLAAVSDRPHLPYEFVILNNSIPNAWALPGGKIAINRGLLIELHSEAELAAVLAHEIVHSAARHGAKAIERGVLMEAGLLGLEQLLKDHSYGSLLLDTSTIGSALIGLRYSREAELEADCYGIKYMVLAGYDPSAAISLQKTFLKLSEGATHSPFDVWFSTHPPSEDRVLANEATSATYPPGGFLGIQEYAEATERLHQDIPAYEKLDKGWNALDNGNPYKAERLAIEAIAIEPNEALFYDLQGRAQKTLKKKEEALLSFDRAIELNPTYFDFYLQRGLLEKEDKAYVLAKLDLEKSISLLPSAEAYYALGEIAQAEGRSQDALKYFQIASKAPSSAGNRAKNAYTAIDLPLHPNQYITTHSSWNAKKQMRLHMTNQSPCYVHVLEIEVTFLDAKKQGIGKKIIDTSETIPPYGTVDLSSNLHAPKNTAYVQAHILRVRIIS